MAYGYSKLEILPKLGDLFDFISSHLKAPLSILVIGEASTGVSTLVQNQYIGQNTYIHTVQT